MRKASAVLAIALVGLAAAGVQHDDASGRALTLKPLTRVQATKIACAEWRAWSQTQGDGFIWKSTTIYPVVHQIPQTPNGFVWSTCRVIGFYKGGVPTDLPEAEMKVNVIQSATCRFIVNGGIKVPNYPQGTYGLGWSRGRYSTTCAKLRR
jgi:hypothetical protein